MIFSTAFPLTLKSLFGLIYSFLFTLMSLFGTMGAGYTDTMPETSDDFNASVRFVVCSDSHEQNGRIQDMIETCYDIYGEDGIDLFVHCGDFTEIGGDEKAQEFFDVWNGAISEGSAQSLVILGNHDLKSGYDAEERFSAMTTEKGNYLGTETGLQCLQINGFYFIGVPSYTESAIQIVPASAQIWAAQQVAEAEENSGTKAIFTFQHPHNRGTVYGSTIWGCDNLNKVWEGHSRVVNFSGHSHFPIEDPRSIWQGTYTAVGTGAMARFELEKDLIWSQHPDGYTSAQEFQIVEADDDGSVRILQYDLLTDTFFGELYIDNVNDPDSFEYTYKNRVAYDDAPVFADDTEVTAAVNENGETVVTFDRATDKLCVHDYKVTVKTKCGIIVKEETFLNDYFYHDVPEQFSVNLGDLSKLGISQGDEFTVEIIAANCYYELSDTFTANVTAEPN